MANLRNIPLHTVPVLHPSATLAEAERLATEEPLGVVVLVGDGQYMGVFSRADMETDLIPRGADHELLAVGPYASTPNQVGRPDMDVETALEEMDRRQVNVLPYVEGKIYRGLITRSVLEEHFGE